MGAIPLCLPVIRRNANATFPFRERSGRGPRKPFDDANRLGQEESHDHRRDVTVLVARTEQHRERWPGRATRV